jgi:hypothetical protein
MRAGTRITKNNIHLLADEVGVSAKDLYDEMIDAKLAFKKEQDKIWSYEFFEKDEEWYDDTMQKIQDIRKSFPDDINPKEATIKMYGWIEKNGKKNLSMPMMYDKDYPEYAHAVAVEFILTNPDSYHKMMNWD